MKYELHLSPPQYILNDMISYPDETFMDMEFKISVMYDIAKVLFVFVTKFFLWLCHLFILFVHLAVFCGGPNRKTIRIICCHLRIYFHSAILI